jgi:elongation factor G
MTFPEPVIHVAIEPKTKADQDKMGKAIQKLAEEDPTFQVRTDEETGQTIIAGMGELHLEVLVDRMRASSRSRPTSASRRWPTARRSPRRSRSTTYTHKKQTGGSGQFAKVIINLEPNPGIPRAAETATSSSTRSPVVASRASTSRRSTTACSEAMETSACSPATRWSTSR